jgi:hypothetical protein
MVLRIAVLLLFIGQFYVAKAQHDQFLGNFPIYNFTNDDFNSPVQIWTGCQTENGVLLFGNDEKIIRFNGKDWTFIQTSVKDTAYTTKQISNKKVFKLFKSTTGIVYGARNNGLLRATNEFQLVKPNEILDKLRELVLESFKGQGTNDVKDGMDLGLACIDKDKMQLEFSGANNSCVIVRNGELIEIKGDKQPIGDFELAKPFTNQTFHLEKGDNIYLFTDGYVDQYGGEDEASRQNGGKKFKSKHFKQFLIEISHHEMKTQEKLIVEKFDNWRGEIEAIDDVCVFGVKI